MKTTNRKIKMILEKTDTGFSAFSEDYPVYTTGKTVPELIGNAVEAASFCFEEENIRINPENIKFEIDFKQFFQYYRVINAKFLADRIGMNPTLLSQYVQGHKKPSDTQANKILMGIHRIGRELSEINLIHRP
jgi:predicted RNase H-like HicB family nuclease